MQLSPHFHLAEFVRTQHKVDNTPTLVHIRNMEALCERVLEPLREHFKQPIRITSGFRSYALNKAVGGSTTSYHSRGMAADIQIDGVSPRDIAQYIDNNLLYRELILESVSSTAPDGVWVHVAYDPSSRLKPSLLTMVRNPQGKPQYQQGLIVLEPDAD